MAMTLEQVRDWHREETRILSKSQHPLRHDSTELKALEDQHKEMADAIDARLAGMGEPVAWQQKRRPSDYPDEWRECSKEVFDMISRTTDSPWVARELFASPPIDMAAVREVIVELRQQVAAQDYPALGAMIDWANKLEAAMPKEAK